MNTTKGYNPFLYYKRSLKKNKLKHDDSVVIVYLDKVSAQNQTTITTTWRKKGSPPKVKSFPAKCRISCNGFLNPQTGALYVATPDIFNYETAIEATRSMFKDCPHLKDKRYVMIMDNAP